MQAPTASFSQNPASDLTGLDVDLVRERSHHRLALIVDDDEDTLALLKLTLRREGINVVTATSGAEALQIAAEMQPHVILLDIMMPGMDGWETLHQLHKFSPTPVVIISAILHEDAVVRAFGAGAQDYIRKPYSHKEIIARIQAVMNRSAPPEPQQVMVFPDYGVVIDLNSRQVRVGEELVKLTPQEYEVLSILADHVSRPVTYQTISEKVWGEYTDEIQKRLKWVIHSLRKKLEPETTQEAIIVNYQRFGYMLRG